MTNVPAKRLATALVGAFLAAVGVTVILSCGYALLGLRDVGMVPASELGDGLVFIAASSAYASAERAFLAIVLLGLPHVIVSQRLQHTSKNYWVFR